MADEYDRLLREMGIESSGLTSDRRLSSSKGPHDSGVPLKDIITQLYELNDRFDILEITPPPINNRNYSEPRSFRGNPFSNAGPLERSTYDRLAQDERDIPYSGSPKLPRSPEPVTGLVLFVRPDMERQLAELQARYEATMQANLDAIRESNMHRGSPSTMPLNVGGLSYGSLRRLGYSERTAETILGLAVKPLEQIQPKIEYDKRSYNPPKKL